MNYRSDRVSGLIQTELSKIMLRELEFNGALVTITSVAVDKKLEEAQVKLGILPPQKTDDVLRYLKTRQGEMQHLLNRKLNIWPMPRIAFMVDEGIENAAKVEKLLLEEDNEAVN
jgi:ribosome-binding factor A